MSFVSLPSTKAPGSAWRTFAPVALAFLVVLLGSRIPSPGLDTAALAEQLAYASNNAMARFSIFVLGVAPLFAVLAYAEIAKLIFPSIVKWQAASPDKAYRMSFIIKSVVLLFTATQGYGIMSALAVMGLADDSVGSMVVGIASFVGASALLIWLADMIRLPGLGSGVWLLLTVPLLGALPGELAESFELVRLGAVPAINWLIPGVFLAVAVAMVVVANEILSGSDRGRTIPVIPLAVLLWPPFLAKIVVGYLIAVALSLVPELLSNAPWLFDLAALAATAIFVPLFVFAYFRLLCLDQRDAALRSDIRSVLLTVAGIQVLVCVGIGVLDWVFPLPVLPDGGMLVVFVTVMLAFRNAVKRVLQSE